MIKVLQIFVWRKRCRKRER